MKNWHHQAHEWQIGRDKRAMALLWSMRTGKSKAVIDKTLFQYKRGKIEGALVIAPNGVHINWTANEISRWGSGVTFAWSTPHRADFDVMAKFEAFLAAPGLKWFAINMEAMNNLDAQKAIRRFLAACHRKFHMIVSEAHHFGRAGAKRTRLARGLAKHAAYRTVETGTAILNSPLRAFSIFEILEPGWSGFETYKQFVNHFAEFIPQPKSMYRRRPKLKGYKNLDELRELMAKFSSVVLREDVDDMPELIRTERPVVMSEVQRHAYLEMVAKHLVELEGGGMVSAKDGGARFIKLQQIVNGYLMHEGRIIDIDPDAPIYAATIEQIEGTLPGKSIVWCRFREDIRRLKKKLDEAGIQYLEYHGGVPTAQREPVRLAFQNDDAHVVLLGQPDAGGEGKDFSRADAVIFFSSTPNAKTIAQSEERATAKGGKSVAIVRMTTPGTVDDRNWEIVDGKITLADTVSGRGLRDFLLQTSI